MSPERRKKEPGLKEKFDDLAPFGISREYRKKIEKLRDMIRQGSSTGEPSLDYLCLTEIDREARDKSFSTLKNFEGELKKRKGEKIAFVSHQPTTRGKNYEIETSLGYINGSQLIFRLSGDGKPNLLVPTGGVYTRNCFNPMGRRDKSEIIESDIPIRLDFKDIAIGNDEVEKLSERSSRYLVVLNVLDDLIKAKK